MSFEPGDVVFLKSGGQSLTVAAVDEDSVECIWMGEEGELFRETLPSVVLTKAQDVADDDIEDDDLEDDELDDEDEEQEADEAAEKRKIA